MADDDSILIVHRESESIVNRLIEYVEQLLIVNHESEFEVTVLTEQEDHLLTVFTEPVITLTSGTEQGIPGPIGPIGPQGVAGTSWCSSVAFAYNQVSPVIYPITIPAGKLVLECQLLVETPLDGEGSSLSIGTLTNPEALMARAQCDPAQLGNYLTSPGLRFATEQTAGLFIIPGIDASQGAGRFLLAIEA